MKSPFIYGSVVSAKSFTNREKDQDKLKTNLISGINTMIISPRRWGKSSLVAKVFNDIQKKENRTRTVIIDLFSVSSEEEFLEMFAREIIKASSSEWEDWVSSVKELFKKLVPKVSIGIDPQTDFLLSFNWDELRKNKNEILDLPETLAKKRKIEFIIGLDEFQNISTFKDYRKLEKNMRAVWQRQSSVTYCIFGSKRHMMTNIFDNSANPFYRFGDIILLSKIDTNKWVSFISRGFKRTNKTIDKLMAKKIADLMKNHSWYVQQLSHYVWNITTGIVKEKEIESALNEVVNANSPLYQQEVEQLSKTQLNLLKAIVNNAKQLGGVATINKYQLGTSRNVSKNKTILLNKDIINKTEDGFELLDPVFEIWFKNKFFNTPFFMKNN